MKYKVYGNYVFSKFLGEVEASSQEEAIEKALDDKFPYGKPQTDEVARGSGTESMAVRD